MLITNTNKGAFSDISYLPAQETLPTALIYNAATPTTTIEGDAPQIRIPFIATDPAAAIVGEGNEIGETDPQLTELTVGTNKISVLTVLSRESYFAGGVADMVTESVRRAVIQKADAVFCANPATAGQPTGLINIPDILNAGVVTTNLDTIVDALATLQTNGATPTHILASPTAWASLQKLKTSTELPLVGGTTNAAIPQVLGLPVIVNRFIPENTLLISDRNEILSSTGELAVSVSDQRYFEKDAIGLRITLRIGFGVLHPNRLAKLTIKTA